MKKSYITISLLALGVFILSILVILPMGGGGVKQ